jgi:hypothetical protein
MSLTTEGPIRALLITAATILLAGLSWLAATTQTSQPTAAPAITRDPSLSAH